MNIIIFQHKSPSLYQEEYVILFVCNLPLHNNIFCTKFYSKEYSGTISMNKNQSPCFVQRKYCERNLFIPFGSICWDTWWKLLFLHLTVSFSLSATIPQSDTCFPFTRNRFRTSHISYHISRIPGFSFLQRC